MERVHDFFSVPVRLFRMRSASSARSQSLPLMQDVGPRSRDLLRPGQKRRHLLSWGALAVTGDLRMAPDVSAAGTAELQQYGALPWRTGRDGKTRILLVTSRERGRWIIPKGWPIEDQPPFVTASREAFEEAGIIGDIYPQPVTDYLYMKRFDDGSLKPCRVTVFSMKVYGTLSNWREQHQRRRCWFSVEEAADRLDDAELGEFVRLNGPFPGKPRRLPRVDEPVCPPLSPVCHELEGR